MPPAGFSVPPGVRPTAVRRSTRVDRDPRRDRIPPRYTSCL